MRHVLRQGNSEGRVDLPPLARPHAIGVGALAGLAGEVTILDGKVLIAAGAPAKAAPAVRLARAGEQATLLVLADVPKWEEIALGDVADYAALEARIARVLRDRGQDLDRPQPVRVRGRASRLALHVIAGACPIAQPDGPPPWRFDGGPKDVELVGFYVENAAGRFTHHNRRSHLHAVADRLMGHLDEVTLRDAVLRIPRRAP